MSSPQVNQTGTPVGSAIVAVALLLVVGAVFVVSIIRYQPDEALKIIGGTSGIVGVITGAFVSYFFTRSASQTAQTAARAATDTAVLVQQTADNATTDQRAFRDVVANLLPDQIEDLKGKSSAVREALSG